MVRTAADPDPRLSSFYADLTSLELILGTLAQRQFSTGSGVADLPVPPRRALGRGDMPTEPAPAGATD